MTTEKEKYEDQENTSQQRLKEYNLNINRTKTEKFVIPEPPPPPQPDPKLINWSELDWTLPSKAPKKTPDWTNMKILGTYVITQTDIINRKAKAMHALKTNAKYFKSDKISNKLKIRIFECYVSSAFLYNSETWSLTKTQETEIDQYHRRLLRYAINKQYPKRISNQKLYEVTQTRPWSQAIKNRRLNTTGHILRLPSSTPIKASLQEVTKPCKNNRGRPRNTWFRTIQNDLKHQIKSSTPSNFLRDIDNLAFDRDVWRGVTRSAMSRVD